MLRRTLIVVLTLLTVAGSAVAADPIISATAKLTEQRTRIQGHVLDLRATVSPSTREYSDAVRAYTRAASSMNSFLRSVSEMKGPESFAALADEAVAVNADVAACARSLAKSASAPETKSFITAAAIAPAAVELLTAVVHRLAARKERKKTEAVLKYLQWPEWEAVQ